MLGRNFAGASLIAAIVLSGMAPVSANTHAHQHATQSARTLGSRKAETAQITKNTDLQERTRTVQLNSSQLNEPRLNPSTQQSFRLVHRPGPFGAYAILPWRQQARRRFVRSGRRRKIEHCEPDHWAGTGR